VSLKKNNAMFLDNRKVRLQKRITPILIMNKLVCSILIACLRLFSKTLGISLIKVEKKPKLKIKVDMPAIIENIGIIDNSKGVKIRA
jgi:hypothetical protein